MKSNEQCGAIQNNIAHEQRNAARDYNEHRHFNSSKEFLKLASADEIERQSKENELLFRDQFRFAVPARQRLQFWEIKKKWDFTNEEMTQLRRLGLIRLCAGKPALLEAPISLAFYGSVIILPPLLYAAFFFFLIFFSKIDFTFEQRALQVAVLVLSLLMLKIADYSSFGALRVLRRRGIQLGQTITAP